MVWVLARVVLMCNSVGPAGVLPSALGSFGTGGPVDRWCILVCARIMEVTFTYTEPKRVNLADVNLA